MDPTKQPFSTSGDPSNAPPQYTSPQVWGPTRPPISDKAPHPEKNLTYDSTSTSGTYQSQPPQIPRLLHIYRTSLLSHNLNILAPDKTTTAYTIRANSGSLFSSKPHMKIYRGIPHPTTPDPPVGTVTFHTLTRTIDLTLHDGRPATLSHHGLFSCKYEFPSTIGVLRWKTSSAFKNNLVCETVAGGEWVAKFDAASFAVEKRGKFEIVSWDVGEEAVDEIVVSGLAVVEKRRREAAAVSG